MANTTIWAISIAAIVIASIGIVITIIPMEEATTPTKLEKTYEPQTREIYLFTQVDEHIDEENMAIPPDMYSQDTIVVNQGDKVKVHFYNLEPVESQEHHTFTIYDSAYKIHYDLNAGENAVIEFIASTSGVFDYLCTYHQPTMKGELVVLPAKG